MSKLNDGNIENQEVDLGELSDADFIALMLGGETYDSTLTELEKRLSDSSFKEKYQQAIEEKYNTSAVKRSIDYIPLIVFILLLMCGVYLLQN